jgi:hypothetical protein
VRRLGRVALVAIVVEAVAVVGVLAYSTSSTHRLGDPVQGLRQLDLLYLDEPAPLPVELGLPVGIPSMVVVCGCPPPEVSGRVLIRVSEDRAVARAYGLLTTSGRAGPGYALVDTHRRLRYRTFDPGLSDHSREVSVLLEALR